MRRSREAKGSLAGQASRALGWSFASNAVARLGSLPIAIMLARMLGPHEFGTFAVALVALTAVLSFNDLGVSLAIVRWEGESAEIVPTVATLSVGSSLITYAGCFLGAPAFASAMGAPGAAGVVRVLALNVIVDGVTATPVALMQRYFSQNRKAIADQVYTWLGAALSLVLVWQGFGAMGMALGWLVGAVVAGFLYWVLAPQPVRFGFDPGRVRDLCRFGLPLAGSAIVVFAVTSVDQVVVGHMLGITALGYYALALNLATWPVSMFSWPTQAVVPAVFSRLQHDRPAMRSGFVSMASLLGSMTLPICALVAGVAVPLIGFVYGARWVPAAHALIWLAGLGALRILFEFVYDFFVVLGRTRAVFTVQVMWLVALIPALIAGASADGIAGAGLAQIAVAAGVVLPWYLRELSKVGIRRRDLGARFWLPLAAAGAVCAAGAAAARLIQADLGALAVGGMVALGTIGMLGYRMRDAIASLRADFRQRPAAGPAGPADLAGGPGPGRGEEPVRGPEPARGPEPVRGPEPARRPEPARGLGPVLVPAFAGALPPATRPDRDITGPLLVYRDTAAWLHRDVTGPLPVYRDTVSALRWDPARGRRGRHARRTAPSAGGTIPAGDVGAAAGPRRREDAR